MTTVRAAVAFGASKCKNANVPSVRAARRPALICDCTTRNARKAAALAERMDELEIRIAELRELDDLERRRLALDVVAVMELLNIAPSPAVGRAHEFLMEIRLDEGEITPHEAAVRIREWWSEQEK
jgi:poly(A) polymerase